MRIALLTKQVPRTGLLPALCPAPQRFCVLLLLCAFLGSCSGNGGGANFARCGNGVLDSGEQCDDGNTSDTDTCTSACQDAVCGDAVVRSGVEECDGFDLLGSACQDLDLGPGTLSCDPSCQFDTSACGTAFTPTSTASPTIPATATPPSTQTPTALPTGQATVTPLPTKTATPDPCGDGLLESDETCVFPGQQPDRVGCQGDDCRICDEDCVPSACTVTGETYEFAVDFASPQGTQATAATVLLAYRSSVVSIPGSGFEPSVRQRIIVPAPPPFLFTPNDLDYAVRVVLVRTTTLEQGLLFDAVFDGCQDAAAPNADDFTCFLDGCGGAGGTVDGCSCSVRDPLQ